MVQCAKLSILELSRLPIPREGDGALEQ